MNVLFINTYRHGGAATSAIRLQSALNSNGVNVAMLNAKKYRLPFYAERLSFLPYERDKSVRFSFSLANYGNDISKHPLVQAADILHLHWINQGFLSLENIKQLASLGKPIVWSLHDMWAFTGGCHYSGDCSNYRRGCGNCAFLKNPNDNDLSSVIVERKKSAFSRNIVFLPTSQWLEKIAKESFINKNTINYLPTPIDTDVFKPVENKNHIRLKLGLGLKSNVVLFVATKVSEERKGFVYFVEMLKQIKFNCPNIEVLIAGKTDESAAKLINAIPFNVKALGSLDNTNNLVDAYNASDVFVIPSLEDNLPNTVLESLSCGTPIVGFNTGGVSEMVIHKQQGYICYNVQGLADGVNYVLGSHDRLSISARNRALSNYSNKVVSSMYINAYQKLLNSSHSNT
jgi:glycosyltransferase involved in cell wall biosynthesis